MKWLPVARLSKYDDEQAAYVQRRLSLARPTGDAMASLCKPYEVIEVEGNLVTTAGLNLLTGLIIGASASVLGSTRVRLGVGDSAAAAALTDAALTTGTNSYFRVMDATYPQRSNGVMTFKATWQTGEGNFAWNCWGLDQGTATVTSGQPVNTVLVNRKTFSGGTKASGIWDLTVTITLA